MAIARKSTAKTLAKAPVKPIPQLSAALPKAPEIETRTLPGADAMLSGMRNAQESLRKATEQSLEKNREAYARLKGEAEVATGSLETSFATARAGVQALNAKAFAALQTQTQASFDHAKAMFEARQPQEAVSMQSEFIRKQFEAFAAQAKDFSAQWQKIATDTFEPLKHTMSKHFPA